jgi:hypothetical protein
VNQFLLRQKRYSSLETSKSSAKSSAQAKFFSLISEKLPVCLLPLKLVACRIAYLTKHFYLDDREKIKIQLANSAWLGFLLVVVVAVEALPFDVIFDANIH